MFYRCLAIFLLSVCVHSSALAQNIGFVDMDYILENMSEYTSTLGELEKQITTYQLTLDNMQQSIDSAYRKLESEKFLLTELAIENRLVEIKKLEAKKTELNNTYFGTEGFLVNTRKKIVQPYLDQVVRAIQDYAVENKIDIIFDKKKQNNIIFASPALDFTKEVLKKLSSN